jgi:hypothetical protein
VSPLDTYPLVIAFVRHPGLFAFVLQPPYQKTKSTLWFCIQTGRCRKINNPHRNAKTDFIIIHDGDIFASLSFLG